MSELTLSTSIAPPCRWCGKPKADHTAIAKRCPIGRKHRTLGFTQFHPDNCYAPKSRATLTEVEALREALTPSGDTKAEYIGEFKFPLVIMNSHGEEETLSIYVPWPTIKEIMAAIRARAALSRGKR